MNIHEYQAKKILSRYGVKIPKGMIAYTPNEAREAADKVSEKGPWVLKAQIQSGARKNGYFLEKDAGAEGGIRIVTSRRKIRANADEMLGSTLVTVQTGPSGKKVNRIYVEAFCAVEKAFYMAIAVSRVAAELTLLVAKDYDGDVLQVALTKPEKILKVTLGLEEKITISTTITESGITSLQLIIVRKIKEPISLIRDIKRFSGPWWANSEISKRSETSRLII